MISACHAAEVRDTRCSSGARSGVAAGAVDPKASEALYQLAFRTVQNERAGKMARCFRTEDTANNGISRIVAK